MDLSKTYQDDVTYLKNKVSKLEAQLEREKNLNQCMTDNNEQLREHIEKMKWHDLRKDPNNLPKDRHNVWIVYLNGYYQEEKSVASYRHKFWVIGGLKTECEVIAWCELPQWEIK